MEDPKVRRLVSTSLALLLSASAHALPAPMQVKPDRITAPISGGAVAGGQARDVFSLISIKKENASGGVERLVFEYGDAYGKPLQGKEPGYFHAALDRGGRRVVIDLAQVPQTAVDPGKLARLLAGSRLVASSDMTMDPHDKSTNVTLNLYRPAKMKVLSRGANPAQVVIELEAR